MALAVFLTSDLHLGMKFASLPEVQRQLAEARFSCLQRMVSIANQRGADLFVAAGDLFESVSVAGRDVDRAAKTLGEFQGKLAAVLPGNHDYLAAEDTLWKRFKEAAGDSVLLLEEQRPYPLEHYGLDACLFPGPCVSKHSKSNAIGWIGASDAVKKRAAARLIGVAHGSLEGFSPDFNGDYYPMRPAELMGCGLDLWLLGHTHLRYPAKPGPQDRIFFAGTPEPDGFDCSHEGFAWLLEPEDGGAVGAREIRTGAYRFVREEAEIGGASDLAAFVRRHAISGSARGAREKAAASNVLLKAVLKGRLPPEDFPELERARERLEEKLLYLDWDANGVRELITSDTIDREFPQGSFPHGLLSELAKSGDTEALELAFELLQGARR
jgi:exonuclease SbcD